MKILVAIDSYKGSLSSLEASNAIAEGIKDVDTQAEILTLPLADGGEGTVEALVIATGGKFVKTPVLGPLRDEVEGTYGILGDGKTAVIEVAAACGLPLIPIEKRNPAIATTFGVGQMIDDAIARGCREFVIGLGGSATNDAGVGMLQALGFRFLDKEQQEVGFGGAELNKIVHLDESNVLSELKECTFQIACDVNNPLFGPNGAVHIYGAQKGATPEMIEVLDEALKHFASFVLSEKGIDLQQIAGSGAAGGLGAAFAAFLNGTLQSGVQLILDIVGMEEKLSGVELVITGEGKLDGQTSMGKAPLGIAELAKKHDIPVVALAGGVTKEATQLNSLGITAFFSIVNGPMSLSEAMDRENAFENLRLSTSQVIGLIKAFI